MQAQKVHKIIIDSGHGTCLEFADLKNNRRKRVLQFCKDCKHIKGWPGIFHECRHPDNVKQSLISGADTTRHSIEACRDPAGHCGVEGSHFESAEPIRREGAEFVVALPEGFDEKTRIAKVPGGLVAVHPDFPPVWHDDKPDERADMHVSTGPGDLDSAGRPLRPGS